MHQLWGSGVRGFVSGMEKIMYETRPFVFMAISVVSIWKNNGTMLMLGSALLLLSCALYVVHMRLSYRRYYRIR